MPDLVLRPSGLHEKHNKPWALQVRAHESSGETEYVTLCRVSDELAKDIMRSGAPTWLFGEPDWDKRAAASRVERARQLRVRADAIESGLGPPDGPA
jgi:hypothetical protein